MKNETNVDMAKNVATAVTYPSVAHVVFKVIDAVSIPAFRTTSQKAMAAVAKVGISLVLGHVTTKNAHVVIDQVVKWYDTSIKA